MNKRILLIQMDGTKPNLALMKIAKWHKNQGDDVIFVDLSTLGRFDRCYGSKIFMGGSGYDVKATLPPDIECLTPDYEKFHLDHSIGFTSRGCIRNCEFCIVPEKEGPIREVGLEWIKGTKVVLMDNNFLASPNWKEKLEYFIKNKIKVSFNQGLDIRLINDENARLLSEVKYYDINFKVRRLYFAFDDPKLEKLIVKNVEILNKHGIPSRHLLFYVLVGFNTTFEEDFHRFQVLDALGCLPFIMVYNNRTDDPVLKHFQRWVNRIKRYNSIGWEEYLKTRNEKFRPRFIGKRKRRDAVMLQDLEFQRWMKRRKIRTRSIERRTRKDAVKVI